MCFILILFHFTFIYKKKLSTLFHNCHVMNVIFKINNNSHNNNNNNDNKNNNNIIKKPIKRKFYKIFMENVYNFFLFPFFRKDIKK